MGLPFSAVFKGIGRGAAQIVAAGFETPITVIQPLRLREFTMAITSHRAPAFISPETHSDSNGRQAGLSRYEPRELMVAASEAMLVVVIAAVAMWAHHSLSSERSMTAAAAAASSPVSSSASMPMSAQLQAWRAEAEPSINALVTARGNIAVTAARHDIAGTAVACQTAGGAITSSRQHMPSPDPELTASFQQAIASYQVGLSYCISGAHNQDAASLRQAAGYFSQGDAALQSAMNILRRGQSVDTAHSPVLFT